MKKTSDCIGSVTIATLDAQHIEALRVLRALITSLEILSKNGTYVASLADRIRIERQLCSMIEKLSSLQTYIAKQLSLLIPDSFSCGRERPMLLKQLTTECTERLTALLRNASFAHPYSHQSIKEIVRTYFAKSIVEMDELQKDVAHPRPPWLTKDVTLAKR